MNAQYYAALPERERKEIEHIIKRSAEYRTIWQGGTVTIIKTMIPDLQKIAGNNWVNEFFWGISDSYKQAEEKTQEKSIVLSSDLYAMLKKGQPISQWDNNGVGQGKSSSCPSIGSTKNKVIKRRERSDTL